MLLPVIKIEKWRLTEFGYVGNVESLHERGPNLRSQAVPEHDTDLVLPLFWYFFGGQEVPADFSNVLGTLNSTLANNSQMVFLITVMSNLTQSFQKAETENFFRMTVLAPKRRLELVAT